MSDNLFHPFEIDKLEICQFQSSPLIKLLHLWVGPFQLKHMQHGKSGSVWLLSFIFYFFTCFIFCHIIRNVPK